MGNLKHSLAATLSVALVGLLAAIQASDLPAAGANKLTQEINIQNDEQAAVQETVPEAVEEIVTEAAPTEDFEIGSEDFSELSPFNPITQAYVSKDVYVLTDGGSINLRASDDIESEVIDTLPLGTKLQVVDIKGEWFNVKVGDKTGFVKSSYTTLDYESVKAVLLATSMYQKAVVNTGVNARSEANSESVILDSVSEEETVYVLDEMDGWCKVYFGRNYDIGYIKSEYLTIGDMVPRSEVNAKRNKRIASIVKDGKIKTTKNIVDVKIMPDEESETIVTLSNGAKCKIVSGGSNWTKIIVLATNEIGYVKTANVEEVIVVKEQPKKQESNTSKNGKSSSTNSKSETKSAPASSGKGSKLVSQAAKYLGVKYVYGGSSPSGFDCSGLVQYCCRQLGVSVNRTASAQYSNGVYVSRDNLQPGDLVFFSRGGRISHVVIYAGNGMVIHAPHTGAVVSYQSLSKICSYSHYVGARRVM